MYTKSIVQLFFSSPQFRFCKHDYEVLSRFRFFRGAWLVGLVWLVDIPLTSSHRSTPQLPGCALVMRPFFR